MAETIKMALLSMVSVIVSVAWGTCILLLPSNVSRCQATVDLHGNNGLDSHTCMLEGFHLRNFPRKVFCVFQWAEPEQWNNLLSLRGKNWMLLAHWP